MFGVRDAEMTSRREVTERDTIQLPSSGARCIWAFKGLSWLDVGRICTLHLQV